MHNRLAASAAPVKARRRTRPARIVAFAILGLCASSVASEFNPARTEPGAAAEYSSGRVIVKFRGTVAAATAEKVTPTNIATQKVAALSARSGITFKQARRLGPVLQVLEIAAPATSENMDAHLAILRADPDVEFAEPDLRRFPHAVPDDPLFAGQWYLQNSTATPSAVDAVNAWDLTTGSSGVIVADLDTGVRYAAFPTISLGGGLRFGTQDFDNAIRSSQITQTTVYANVAWEPLPRRF